MTEGFKTFYFQPSMEAVRFYNSKNRILSSRTKIEGLDF